MACGKAGAVLKLDPENGKSAEAPAVPDRHQRPDAEEKAKKPGGSKPHVIMITGNQGARHKMYAESLGVSEYFNKPVKLDKLITAAERLLGAAPTA